MTDCIYHAWRDHARWLGVEPPVFAHALFRFLYWAGGNEGGMFGGCVPFVIRVLNEVTGLEIAQVWHHPFWDKAAHVASAENWVQWLMAGEGDFGGEGSPPAPAIYLWLGGHHAFFSECPLAGMHTTLAIQLRRRK